jgi:hypothetical protein
VYGGMFLNSIASFGGYREIAETRFFVDKTDMIDEIIDMAMAVGIGYDRKT